MIQTVQFNYKQSPTGVVFVFKGEKERILGVWAVVGVVQIVRLRKGSRCWPKGLKNLKNIL